MDPNIMLTNLRELVRAAGNPGAFTADIMRDLAERFNDLDHWLTDGGFPPDAWRHAR